MYKRQIVGVGINVNTDISELPCEVRDKATSLKDIIGLELDLNELLSVSAEEVFKWLSFLKTDNGQKKVIESYKNHCVTLGSQVSIYLDNETISGLAAVSYTHLDVYKRQFLTLSLLGTSSFSIYTTFGSFVTCNSMCIPKGSISLNLFKENRGTSAIISRLTICPIRSLSEK